MMNKSSLAMSLGSAQRVSICMKHPTESSVKDAVSGSRGCLGHDSGQTNHGGSGCKGNYRETNTDVWFVSFHSIHFHFTHRVGQKEPKAKVRLGLVVRRGGTEPCNTELDTRTRRDRWHGQLFPRATTAALFLFPLLAFSWKGAVRWNLPPLTTSV